ncbi:MAG: UPF0236 family transposase-like protein [Actinomycetota bacterium]
MTTRKDAAVPDLTVTVRVPWPKHPTLLALEKAIFKALMAAGRELLKAAFRAIEQMLLAEGAGARQRRRRRYLITRFGELRFHRWQTRTEAGYAHPLDDALGIPGKDPCSPWVRQMAAFLAQAHPFRQAARLLSWMIGCGVDHRRLWGWVQTTGRGIRSGWEAKRAALFDQGVLPGPGGRTPAIVSTAADGTFIHSRDGPIEVKLGVWWTGASPAGAGRYLLEGKGYYATTESADAFGQTFYVLAEEATGISRAAEVFYVGDGAGWVGTLPGEWLRPTAIQLDHFHGKLRIKELARDPDRAARWWGYVASDNLDALGRSLAHYIRAGQVDPKAGEDLLGYFRRGAAALDTYLRLREAGHSAQMAPRGSGVIEHGVDLVVARRFKRQGMRSWSREGADNLLAARVLAMDREGWRAFWGEGLM